MKGGRVVERARMDCEGGVWKVKVGYDAGGVLIGVLLEGTIDVGCRLRDDENDMWP